MWDLGFHIASFPTMPAVKSIFACRFEIRFLTRSLWWATMKAASRNSLTLRDNRSGPPRASLNLACMMR